MLWGGLNNTNKYALIFNEALNNFIFIMLLICRSIVEFYFDIAWIKGSCFRLLVMIQNKLFLHSIYFIDDLGCILFKIIVDQTILHK